MSYASSAAARSRVEEAVFQAVADPTRRAILDRLARGELAAGEIAAEFPGSRPGISRHLRVLREAGLVTLDRRGRLRVYAVRPAGFEPVDDWLTAQKLAWAARLVALKRQVESKSRRDE